MTSPSLVSILPFVMLLPIFAVIVIVYRRQFRKANAMSAQEIEFAKQSELQWKIPEELLNCNPPRTVQLSKSGRTQIGLSVLINVLVAGMMGFSLFSLAKNMSQIRELLAHGQSSDAVILNWHAYRSKNSRGCTLQYKFEWNEQTYLREALIPGMIDCQDQMNRHYPVTFLADHPEVSRLSLEGLNYDKQIWATVPFVVVFGIIFVMIPMVMLKRRKILTFGTATKAIIHHCRRAKSAYSIKCTFRDTQGIERSFYDNSSIPIPVGTSVTVLYLPQNPKSAALYPIQWFSLALPIDRGPIL